MIELMSDYIQYWVGANVVVVTALIGVRLSRALRRSTAKKRFEHIPEWDNFLDAASSLAVLFVANSLGWAGFAILENHRIDELKKTQIEKILPSHSGIHEHKSIIEHPKCDLTIIESHFFTTGYADDLKIEIVIDGQVYTAEKPYECGTP